MDDFDVGDVARLSVAFTVDGTYTDPTTVTLKVKNPSTGVTASYTYAALQLNRSDTGQYYYDLSLTVAGSWFFRWEATGTVQTAEEGWVYVRESRF